MSPLRILVSVSIASLASACGDGGDADGSATLSSSVGSMSGSQSASASDSSGADGSEGSDSATGGSGSATTSMSTSASTGADGTTDPTATGSEGSDTGNPPMVSLPPPDGGLDYQLGGAYPPPRGTMIVSRDRHDAPADGLYNVCYVNGFQAQPDEESFWLDQHPELVLRDGNGDPVIDQDWDEMLLDTSTDEKRTALAAIMGEWIAGCGSDGYDAVEIDNLDSYSRSQGLLSQDDAVAYMALLSASAHDVGLAIAQKNSTEILDRADEMGTDFAVAEECSTYDECGDYVGVYGDAVLMIEYEAGDFDKGCTDWPGYSIVLRDVELSTPGGGGYVYDAC
ncbi:MAG: endo alpha-1,4 polygalactosaminidase [Nannocystaceae bacterium]|nr:endo alpha-1,4 polygalactosaminidase [Nannocystaceae bacterium]